VADFHGQGEGEDEVDQGEGDGGAEVDRIAVQSRPLLWLHSAASTKKPASATVLLLHISIIPVRQMKRQGTHRAQAVNCGLTARRPSARPGHLATLAGFWPHSDAQRCRLLRSSEQDSTRSASI
jgi:hypothetical protein